MSMQDMTHTITGFAHKGHVLIWAAEDVAVLDREWRMCNGLIGSLPGQPRQNVQLSLPYKLSQEETTLLIEKGALELLEYSPPTPSQRDITEHQESREKDFQQQFVSYLERREEERLRHVSSSDLPQSKRAKIEVGDYRQHSSFSPLVRINVRDPRPSSVYQHCTSWSYPATDRDRQCYMVYKDLWEQGYTLTSGLKYGGDYLVYQGHPNDVHSTFIAIVLSRKQDIHSFGSLSRVGSKVNKSVLLCTVTEGVVHYITTDWSM